MNNTDEIEALFDQWNNALKIGDPKEVAALMPLTPFCYQLFPIKFVIITKKLKIILFTSAKYQLEKLMSQTFVYSMILQLIQAFTRSFC